ncbi:sugar phosphate isomerase/epimerase family protein [Streptomyces sp. NPDC060184]|uniref:sugar phosphate isomerase/epimerase family protein n=1 Tax=Streptomyces sp. NPDC060184 TaxID=3347064 RepID=UPI003651B11F
MSRPVLTGVVDWRLPVRGVEAVDLAFRHRVDGIQFDLGGPGRGPRLDAPGRLARVRTAARSAGVVPLGVTANLLNDIGVTAAPGTLEAARVRTVLARLVDAGGELGAPLVFVPSFRRSAIRDEADLLRTAEVLGPAAERARAAGLLLASENVLPAHLALRLADAVGQEGFRLLLDTYNPVAEGLDVPELVARTAPLLDGRIHLKDGLAGSTTATPLLGDGDGNLVATVDAVARHLPRVTALVLENDHRDGDSARLRADLDRARAFALGLDRQRMEAAPPCPSY